MCNLFKLPYSNMPRDEGDDKLTWKLTGLVFLMCAPTIVQSFYLSFPLEEHLAFKGTQKGVFLFMESS